MELFPHQTIFLEKLLASKKYSAVRHLSTILKMKGYYAADDLDRVFAKCIQWNNFSADVFVATLRNHAEICHQPCPVPEHEPTNPDEPDLKRQLHVYEQLY
jgi:hypothetical protein